MEKIYEMTWSKDHLVDVEYDIFHMPFEMDESYRARFFGGSKYNIQKNLLFSGDIKILGEIDFIVNDLWLPIFSKRMIDLLTSLGSFEYELITCGIFDFTLPHEKVFEDRSKWIIKNGIEVNKDYFALRLLDPTVEIDYDKSEYDIVMKDPLRLGTITKLVVKESVGGLPPIFKIKEKPSRILVTESVKDELEAAGLQGLVFDGNIF
ncbi:imm11 family protein [Spirochaeta cellobiosiphila]|uniref:imm11 family protein n=1 Tax=Spirochaeta cellobiosiphila TaxID=504483 RepID=UPI0004280B44|nr:DUF1629 domain-containing protein [Spirochaeta cellobiosiphila]